MTRAFVHTSTRSRVHGRTFARMCLGVPRGAVYADARTRSCIDMGTRRDMADRARAQSFRHPTSSSLTFSLDPRLVQAPIFSFADPPLHAQPSPLHGHFPFNRCVRAVSSGAVRQAKVRITFAHSATRGPRRSRLATFFSPSPRASLRPARAPSARPALTPREADKALWSWRAGRPRKP